MKFKTKLFLGIFGLLIFLIAFSAFSETITEDNSSNINKYNENQLNLSDSAVIWTDKEDYSPGEIVTIYGSGFKPKSLITLTIERPDETDVLLYAFTDDLGDFQRYYNLNGVAGLYKVTATDGTNSATTTFTDCCPIPNIDVEKEGPLYAHEDDSITYEIKVINCGNTKLYDVIVEDSALGFSWTGTLAVGEVKIFSIPFTVPVDGDDSIINTATATGRDCCYQTVFDEDSWEIIVLKPSIGVTKEA
ncbi:MAG: hypothetical protein ACFFA2_10965, partial [Promethearchaeota archaeon]